MSSSAEVLVVGDGAAILTSLLLTALGGPVGDQSQDTDANEPLLLPLQSSVAVTTTVTVRLETKYYTALVDVRCVPPPHSSSNCSSNLSITDANGTRRVEALILTFTSSSCSSGGDGGLAGSTVQARYEELKESCPQIDDAPIRLVVVMNANCKSCVQQWCAQETFELVEVSTALPPQSQRVVEGSGGGGAALLGHGCDEDNQEEGVPRIVQALHAHCWPGLQLLQRTSLNSSPTTTDDEVTSAAASRPEEAAADDGRRCSSKFVDGGIAAASQQQQHDNVSCSRHTPPAPSDSLVAEFLDKSDGEFTGILQEMKKFRETSKELSDEDRREGACALALKLAAMWQCEETDGDDDDSAASVNI